MRAHGPSAAAKGRARAARQDRQILAFLRLVVLLMMAAAGYGLLWLTLDMGAPHQEQMYERIGR